MTPHERRGRGLLGQDAIDRAVVRNVEVKILEDHVLIQVGVGHENLLGECRDRYDQSGREG